MNWDLPEVRVRQPEFSVITYSAGLTSLESMRAAFDVDPADIEAAVRGGPVSPDLVASVLIMFPEQTFRDLFQLDMNPHRPR